jgi:single-stranded DNA-specific DHH superfamily exonuclease
MGTLDTASNTWFIKLEAPFAITSNVATAIGLANQTQNVFVYQRSPDGKYHISVRSQRTLKHLGEIMRSIASKFQGASGGGHAPAAGGACAEADIEAFIAAFKAAMG